MVPEGFRRRLSFLVFSLLTACFAGPFEARASAASIPVPSQLLMNVRETAGIARTEEVVRSGVPLPRSLNVLDPAGLAVVDAAGRAVPAEIEITARWNAGKNVATAPAQWILVTFPVTVGAYQTATFRLVTDGTVANPATARPLTLTRNGNAVTVDTGAATFRLGTAPGSLFDEVVAANGARLIGGGNLTLRTGGADYGHSTIRKVTIEHQGPLTAIVVVQGTYDAPAIGSGVISTRRRYVFTAGSPTAIVRHVANWEGGLGCEGCVTTSTGGVNGVLIERLRDDLVVDLGGSPTVTAIGNFSAPAVSGPVPAVQGAWVRQLRRPTRTSPQQFDVNVAGVAATGAKADGALLAASGANGTVAIALNHMHRYEPEALRLLPGGRMAIDVVDDGTWIANHQGVFATLAITAVPDAPARSELNRTTWAPLNRPLHAWAEPRWLASSEALDEFPVGTLPSDLAGYDTLVTSVLDRTVRKIDSDGLNGLMTFGVYPRYWGKDNEVGEVECGAGGDPTPNDAWDNAFWCGAWTDYHNTVSTATIWAYRTGDVEWLDEISFPGALRTLHTQMMQCSPTDSWFYCGQSPTGYGAYRTDFNSSHAYFENVYNYYWLTGDQTVLDILQRGGDNMRRWVCPLRQPNGGGSACPADYPVKIEASLTGRVGQQWQIAFRFLGQASNDASFLDDFRSGYARSITQQYSRAVRNGVSYGFWGGPALVTVPGTYQTDSQWTIGMYDMHYLDRLAKDTGDAPLGMPALRPSEVISSIAHTYKDLEPVVIGDGTVSGFWARLLEYSWTGDRVNGTLNNVVGADRELYDPEKTGAAEVLIRAGQREGDAALVDFGRKLTVFTIAAAQREAAPLGKLMGQDLTRLHPAVALLTNAGDGVTPPPPPPPPPSPTVPAAPTNLTGTGTSTSEITLAWKDNSGDETSFRVEQLVGTSYKEVQTLAAGAVTTKIGGLTANTAYTFRVRAANSAGFSAYTNPVTTATQAPTPPPPPPVPAAPSNLAGTATGPGDVTLTWQDNSSDEVSFRVERSINGAFQEIQTVGANVTTARISGLAAGSTHLFRVRAANGAGFSAYSNTASVITPMAPPTVAPPAAPSKLAASALSSTEIQLTWRDGSTNEASFRIERKVGNAYQEILTVAANVTTVKIGGLSPSTTYSFRVRAANTGGFSSYSNIANATTKAAPVAPLVAPKMTSIRYLGSGAAQVTWQDNSTGEIQFQVERMVNGIYSTAATVGANVTTTKVTGLRSRASYTFRVKVTDAQGQVAYSTPMNINTF